MDGKKIALISLGAIVLGVGGYFGFKAIKKLINPANENQGNDSSGSSGSISSSTNSTSLPPTPFKNTTEGNAFRGWVNDNYPSYARQIDLDRTGAYDNSYIRKAWAKYGNEYKNSQSGMGGVGTNMTTNSPSSFDFVTLKSLLNNFHKPVSDDDKLQIATSSDRPRILMDFYPNGAMVVQKDANWYSPVYAKTSGQWAITNNQAKLNLGGQTATITQADNNAIWTILKATNYLNPQNSQFVPFDQDVVQVKRNKKQLDINCEDLM
jgi:hypothetical protein